MASGASVFSAWTLLLYLKLGSVSRLNRVIMCLSVCGTDILIYDLERQPSLKMAGWAQLLPAH